MAKNYKYPPGTAFGRWTVKNIIPSSEGQKIRYVCQCACGKTAALLVGNLSSGSSRSCGCYRKEASAETSRRHGMFGTPEYSAWAAMWTRCTKTACVAYKNYGGRGITVDPAWADFAIFYRDMGNRPSSKHQLDRRDNDGNYSKDNCRWATCKENQNNRRDNLKIPYLGVKITLTEAMRISGLDRATIQARIYRGWPQDKLLLPVLRHGRRTK